MIYGMYLSTAGAKAQSQRQDVIANNIANVDTSGFRRALAIARERLDNLTAHGVPLPDDPANPRQMGGGLHLYRTCNDLSTLGTIKPSGTMSHMAISGKGFFRVRVGQETFLTRNGAFAFAKDGSLTTSNGQATLLSDKGSPIRVDPNRPFEVNQENMVVQDGRSLGTIAVVYPRDAHSVERVGDSMFRYDGQDRPMPSTVQQGFLEGSNVDPVREMVELIESARGFEMNIRMVQLQNDTLGRLVDQVPRPA